MITFIIILNNLLPETIVQFMAVITGKKIKFWEESFKLFKL